MKKILLTTGFCFLTGISLIYAQTLFGTTSVGKFNAGGTINKFIPGKNTLTVIKSFESVGSNPFENFVKGADGKFYGMTREGGGSGEGTIFSFDPTTYVYTRLKDFNSTDGSTPDGGLVQAANGKLYGVTAYGGSNNGGVIFSFDPASSTYEKLKEFEDHEDISFDDAEASYPEGSLIQASNGLLYGMTTGGGDNNAGVIFSFDPVSNAYSELMDLDFENGSNPAGSLLQASDGKLYGTTRQGGFYDEGVIFSFDIASLTYTNLKDLNDTDGSSPGGSLMQASDGHLYGVTFGGGIHHRGAIFSFNISTSAYLKVKDFNGEDGEGPIGTLLQADNGKLYGLTKRGGSSGDGTVYSFDPSTAVYKKLKDFDKANGRLPYYNSLIQANDGKLFGMTSYGGSNDGGVIFSIDPVTLIFSKLKNICTNAEGYNISGDLLHASDRKLYGTTLLGGTKDAGAIFSIDPVTSTYVKLKDFDTLNGAYPNGNLIQAGNGILYGNANGGGSKNYGVIFSYDPVSSMYNKLVDFDSTNGAVPAGGLLQASNGKLYGVTTSGGKGNKGTIFSINPVTRNFTILKHLDDTGGAYPKAGIMQASDGKLYGMTYAGGLKDFGVIFSFDPSSLTYTKLIDFDSTNGAHPYGTLVQARNGKLYGMTYEGGSRFGVLFSFDPLTGSFTKLLDFDYTNGSSPVAALLEASDGKLYGTTKYGGTNFTGVIFSYDPVSSLYVKLSDFNGDNGDNPTSAFVEVNDCLADTVFYRDADGDGYGDPGNFTKACERPAGYVSNSRDCNDLADKGSGIHPGAAEICNGIDDDCDGRIDGSLFEAEQGVLNGAVVATNHAGYDGNGFVDYKHPSADYIEWTLNASTGLHSFKFRYANGGTAFRYLRLTINGVSAGSGISFSPTGSWTIWATSTVTANLVNGINKIRLTAMGSSGPNLDNVLIENIGCNPNYLEAEAGNNTVRLTKTRSYGPNVDHLAFTSSSFVQSHQQNTVAAKVLSAAPGHLKAYIAPNPVEGSYAKLVILTSSVLPVNIRLMDMAGRTIKTVKLLPGGSNILALPVTGLAAGAYTVVVKQAGLITQVRMMVGR